MNRLKKLGAALFAMALPAVPASAQDDTPLASAPGDTVPKVSLKSDVKALVTTVDATGKETSELATATEYTPGTKLSFGMIYGNEGAEAATSVTGTSPLNKAVRLAPDADPALIVSVDGGESFGTLDTLVVATESGATRAATHADVTHVRWTIASIAPGESGRIGFPVIIR